MVDGTRIGSHTTKMGGRYRDPILREQQRSGRTPTCVCAVAPGTDKIEAHLSSSPGKLSTRGPTSCEESDSNLRKLQLTGTPTHTVSTSFATSTAPPGASTSPTDDVQHQQRTARATRSVASTLRPAAPSNHKEQRQTQLEVPAAPPTRDLARLPAVTLRDLALRSERPASSPVSQLVGPHPHRYKQPQGEGTRSSMKQQHVQPDRADRAVREAPQATNLLDVGALAERLGVTPRFVRRLVHERRVPFLKIGKFVRFDPREIEGWIDGARQPPIDSVKSA